MFGENNHSSCLAGAYQIPLLLILMGFPCRLYGSGETVSSESHRVQEAGGWIDDGRVCDILAVSRAFGDREFKGDGLQVMLRKGVE